MWATFGTLIAKGGPQTTMLKLHYNYNYILFYKEKYTLYGPKISGKFYTNKFGHVYLNKKIMKKSQILTISTNARLPWSKFVIY